MTDHIAKPYLIVPLELSGYVLKSPDGSRELHACSTLQHLQMLIGDLYSPQSESLGNDGVPPTGGFPRVVGGNEAEAEPARRKGIFGR